MCWPPTRAIRIEARAHKMSKARGNVINPDMIVAEYGADSLRLYEMFMGPLEAVKPWSMKGVEGVYRFLARAWRMIVDAEAATVRLDERVVAPGDDARAGESGRAYGRGGDGRFRGSAVQHGHQPIDGVCQFLHVAGNAALVAMETFTLLLAPMAPHIAEELWHVLGNRSRWPTRRGRSSTLRSWSKIRSRSRCRSTASCAGGC